LRILSAADIWRELNKLAVRRSGVLVQNSSGTPTGKLDDAIAGHAAARGHWPGQTIDQIKQLIKDVRNGWNNRYDAPNGETIYRHSDLILIENLARSLDQAKTP
jgi:hypothetical protein